MVGPLLNVPAPGSLMPPGGSVTSDAGVQLLILDMLVSPAIEDEELWALAAEVRRLGIARQSPVTAARFASLIEEAWENLGMGVG